MTPLIYTHLDDPLHPLPRRRPRRRRRRRHHQTPAYPPNANPLIRPFFAASSPSLVSLIIRSYLDISFL